MAPPSADPPPEARARAQSRATNPFATPEALLDGPGSRPGDGRPADFPFFVVSIPKLVVLTIGSFGLYQLYWFYKNFRGSGRSEISSALRAIFVMIFCWGLFEDVKKAAEGNGIRPRFSMFALVVFFLTFLIIDKLPFPYSLPSALSGLVLVPVQRTVNELRAVLAPTADENANFTLGNGFLLAYGLGVLAFSIYLGTF